MIENFEDYYNRKCYASLNCLHCPDCLAFATKYYHESIDEKQREKRRNLIIKFITSTISSENFTCKNALSSKELLRYINLLLKGEAKLPICHYEFSWSENEKSFRKS